jgi:hypothetical protein
LALHAEHNRELANQRSATITVDPAMAAFVLQLPTKLKESQGRQWRARDGDWPTFRQD